MENFFKVGAYSTVLFLIEMLFNLYIILVLLRFLLQWVRADFYNPFCQFIVKLTQPVLYPLRRVIPSYFGIDWASIILVFILMLIKVLLYFLIMTFMLPTFTGLILWTVADVLSLTFNLYFIIIILYTILTWINPATWSVLFILLSKLVNPLLQKFRRVIPIINGIDLSPLVAVIVLQIVLMLLVYPLQEYGKMLAFQGWKV